MYYWKILCGWIAWRPPKFPRYRTEKWPEGLQDDGLDSRLKKRNNFFVKMDPTQVNNRVSMQLAFTFSFLYLVGKTAINSACFERRKRVYRNVYSVSLKIAMTRIYLRMQGWCYSLIFRVYRQRIIGFLLICFTHQSLTGAFFAGILVNLVLHWIVISYGRHEC